GLALQRGHAVLGDDVVHVVAAGGDGGALIQQGNDLGDLALDGGRHGHDGHAALAGRRAADEVHLTAHAGDLLGTDGLGGHLTHQVHLHAGVDGDEVVVLGDDEGIIDVIHRAQLHVGVV